MHIHHDEKRNPIDFGSRGQRSRSTLALFGTLCIRPCGHNSDFSFCSITFKLHMHIHHDEKRNPIDFGSRGQRSRSTLALFGTLCIRPCGHNSDFSFCSITFKLHMQIHHDDRRNPIDFGSRGHRSRSTLSPCEGMPRFALSSFEFILQLTHRWTGRHRCTYTTLLSSCYQGLSSDT